MKRTFDYVLQGLALTIIASSAVYIAIAVHAASKAAAMHQMTDGLRTSLHTLATHRDLLDVYTRGKKDFDSLADVEKSQDIAYVQGLFYVFYEAYCSWRTGLLPDADWQRLESGLHGLLKTSLFSSYWKLRHDAFPQDFQDRINHIAAAHP